MEKQKDINLKNPENEITPENQNAEDSQKEVKNEWEEKYQHLAADFANYKNRVSREQADLEDRLKEKWLRSILTIYDDFIRLNNQKCNSESVDEGIQAVQKKWQQWFEENQVKIMRPEGEKFDHELHDAVLNLPVSDLQLQGKIVQVIENGFLFKNKVLRHAKVAIGRYEDQLLR